jgi:4-hydroxy-2-oxoheptanedioate aldolase
MRTNSVKDKLQSGQPAVGTWLSLGSVLAARFLARSGFDWLTVDVEHSAVGMETTAAIFGAVADAGGICLARVPSNRHDHIKRMLDCGAHGVVVPMVNTRQEALDAVRACRYPPLGNRSIGGNIHALNWQASPNDYYAKADQEILCVLQCEHIDAVRHFDDVYSVPGCDAVFVGPNDLMASMCDANGEPPTETDFEKTLQDILAGCRRLKIPAGIHTFTLEDAKKRIAEGWQFVAIVSELKMIVEAAATIARAMGLSSKKEQTRY